MSETSVLLHACCAPCSSVALERLAERAAVTLFFYNPNIFPHAEYERRLSELRRFCAVFSVGSAGENSRFAVVEAIYDPEEFYEATGVRENTALQQERERGKRCERCYRFRMQKAFDYARFNNFDAWTTTLSLSPHKDSKMINAIGKEIEETAECSEGVKTPSYLWADFKKRDGYKRSLELSKKYDLYRQRYCGCEFSLRD
jgi:predicted adenine nucleotide alpha hydrolase (AANH) superfamily ATPase